jgi:hypothetical protein
MKEYTQLLQKKTIKGFMNFSSLQVLFPFYSVGFVLAYLSLVMEAISLIKSGK